MLSTLPTTQLEDLIGHFSVPMFVVDETEMGTTLPITCANAAFEEISGRSRDALLGQSVLDLSPHKSQSTAFAAYQRCLQTRQSCRFIQVFERDIGEVHWDQTLQHAQSPEGHNRVLVTAVQIASQTPRLEDKLAFEDLRYFASMADLQLENLNNAFASTSQHAGLPAVTLDRIIRLHAVCRTIQSTVTDMKEVVVAAQARHDTSKRRKQNVRQFACQRSIGQQDESNIDTARAIARVSQAGAKYTAG